MKTVKLMTPGKASALNLTAKILWLFLVFGCQSKDTGVIPQDIIPSDSMTDILTDIHLIEGGRMGNKMMGDTLSVQDYHNKVFVKYNISRKKFEQSFRYYSDHPEIMDDIYSHVIENLSKMEVTPPKENFSELAPADTTAE